MTLIQLVLYLEVLIISPKFKEIDLSHSGKQIMEQVLAAKESSILIPPRFGTIKPLISQPPDDDLYIGLFSSGSTGTPKCIWNSRSRLLKNARYSASAFEIKSSDRLLMMAAPWHVAGLSWMLMAHETGCLFDFVPTKKDRQSTWLDAVLSSEYDYLFTVPAVLDALYQADWMIPKVAYGGYPIRFADYPKLARHCSTMYQGYGQTEAGGLISCYKRSANEHPKTEEHLCNGFAISGVQLRCEGTTEEPEPVYIRSETAFTEDWYDSGDFGYKDEVGRIYLKQREKSSEKL